MAELGVRVEVEDDERGGVELEEDGSDSDSREDEGEREGVGCAVVSAAVV